MTAPAAEAPTVRVVDGMTADDYHRHPALSSTGARKLLPPSCPAIYRYEHDNPPPVKREFNFGHAAHSIVLGDGPDIDVLDHDNYLTKPAKQARDEALDMGAVPLLRHEWEQVQAMADAIRLHPIAGPLFTPGDGVAERSLFWTDGPTGVPCRARLDWAKQGARRFIAADYKSCRSADPEALQRAIYTYGYHQQGDWYLKGVRATGLGDDDAQFVLVFQEKTAPYLVHVVGLDTTALRIGAARNRRALETYAECAATDTWHGYADDVTYLSLPVWAENRDTEEYEL